MPSHEIPRNSSGTEVHNQFPVTSTPSVIVPATVTASRQDVTIINNHATVTFYIGSAAVTSSNGFPLLAGASITRNTWNSIYGVTASSSSTGAYITDDDI
jgi:hypothetical protein